MKTNGWTYEEYKEAIKQGIRQRLLYIPLYTADCPPGDKLKLQEWAQQDGFTATILDDCVEVSILFPPRR